MARRKKRQDSPVKTVVLILAAIVVMSAAIFVVVGIVGKIRSDYQRIEIATKEESTGEAIEIEKEERLGWNQTEEGWIYLLDKETRASDQWLEIEGFLYSFDEDGIMRTGEWSSEGDLHPPRDKGISPGDPDGFELCAGRYRGGSGQPGADKCILVLSG